MVLNYERTGDHATAKVNGTPEEIADLMSLMKERHGVEVLFSLDENALVQSVVKASLDIFKNPQTAR